MVGTTIGELVAAAREDGLRLVVASRCGLLDDRHKLIAWTRWLTWRGPSDGIKAEGGRVVKMVRSIHWCWRSNRCGVRARGRWSMGMGVAGLAAG